jgi:hypothetical protein
MNELAELTIKAHGGLKRWGQFESVSAHLDQGGALWALKGQPGTLDHTNITAGLRSEWASHVPFGPSAARSRFEPHRVALESPAGEVLEELREPCASFAGHTLETPWSALQLAYFVGCAMWTYLNTPFLLAHPGVASEELSPWEENGETWRRLRVNYPDDIATHSSLQTLYINGDGLLKRHDYDVEIAGNTPGAHFIEEYEDVSGIMFPTKRRIFPRQADGTASPEPLVVSIDLSDIALK